MSCRNATVSLPYPRVSTVIAEFETVLVILDFDDPQESTSVERLLDHDLIALIRDKIFHRPLHGVSFAVMGVDVSLRPC